MEIRGRSWTPLLFSMTAVVTPSLGWCQPKARATKTSRSRWPEATSICSSNFPYISHSLNFSSVKWVHSTSPSRLHRTVFDMHIWWDKFQHDKKIKVSGTLIHSVLQRVTPKHVFTPVRILKTFLRFECVSGVHTHTLSLFIWQAPRIF